MRVSRLFDSDTQAKMQADDGAGAPAFISKLWSMMSDPHVRSFICWSASGESIIIKNQERLASDVFPKYVAFLNLPHIRADCMSTGITSTPISLHLFDS